MAEWGRWYNWQMLFWGMIGAALTVLLLKPREHIVTIASFGLDLFYILVLLFSFLAIWSSIDLWTSYQDT